MCFCNVQGRFAGKVQPLRGPKTGTSSRRSNCTMQHGKDIRLLKITKKLNKDVAVNEGMEIPAPTLIAAM